MQGLASLPVFFKLAGARAASRAARRGCLEGRTAASDGRGCRCASAPRRAKTMRALAARGQRSRLSRAIGPRRDFADAALAIGDFATEDEAARFRGGAACARARQCRRQAGILRFPIRHDHRSLAARRRHFDVRRGAGFRARLARPDRGAAAAKSQTWAQAAQGMAARSSAMPRRGAASGRFRDARTGFTCAGAA